MAATNVLRSRAAKERSAERCPVESTPNEAPWEQQAVTISMKPGQSLRSAHIFHAGRTFGVRFRLVPSTLSGHACGQASRGMLFIFGDSNAGNPASVKSVAESGPYFAPLL